MRRAGIREVASLAFKAAYFIRMREVFKLRETTLTEMANISVSIILSKPSVWSIGLGLT